MMIRPLQVGESYTLPDGRRGYLLEILSEEGNAVFGIEESVLADSFRPNVVVQATDERVVVPIVETAVLRRLTDNAFYDGIKYG